MGERVPSKARFVMTWGFGSGRVSSKIRHLGENGSVDGKKIASKVHILQVEKSLGAVKALRALDDLLLKSF